MRGRSGLPWWIDGSYLMSLNVSKVTKMPVDPFRYISDRGLALREFFGPRASGVQHIPRRSKLSGSAITRIIVAKAIHDDVPKWLVPRDQHTLSHPHPDIVKHKKSATKVVEFEVACLLNGPSVLAKSFQQRGSSGRVPVSTSASALWVRLAHIYGRV